jgi:hypothetical protein
MNKVTRWAVHVHDNWFKDEHNLWVKGEINGQRYVLKCLLDTYEQYTEDELSKMAQEALDDLEKHIESERK